MSVMKLIVTMMLRTAAVEKNFIVTVRVSAGTTMRCMSVAYRIWRAVENSQESEGFKVLRKLQTTMAGRLYSPIVAQLPGRG